MTAPTNAQLVAQARRTLADAMRATWSRVADLEGDEWKGAPAERPDWQSRCYAAELVLRHVTEPATAPAEPDPPPPTETTPGDARIIETLLAVHRLAEPTKDRLDAVVPPAGGAPDSEPGVVLFSTFDRKRLSLVCRLLSSLEFLA